MTPTEQDKELSKLLAYIDGSSDYNGAWFGDMPDGKTGRYWWRSELKQLITADRKRVALEEEWKKVDYSNDATLPKVGEPVLCHITYDGKHDATYAVLIRVDGDDCDWRTADDNSEISYWVNVTHWKKFAKLKAQQEEV